MEVKEPVSPKIPIKRLVIDDFVDGEFSIALSDLVQSPNVRTLEDCQQGTMLGGTRNVQLNLCENSYENQASVRVAQSALSFNNDAGVYSWLELSYGVCQGGTPLHVDLTQWSHFKVWFNCNDIAVSLVCLLFCCGGAHYAEGWLPVNHPASNNPSLATLEFSTFKYSEEFTWNDVEKIVFRFQLDSTPDAIHGYFGSDFAIDVIEADFLP